MLIPRKHSIPFPHCSYLVFVSNSNQFSEVCRIRREKTVILYFLRNVRSTELPVSPDSFCISTNNPALETRP